MRAFTIDYFAPARFDDLIEVFVRVSRIGRTSVTYECAAYRVEDDVLMVTAHQTLVLVELATHTAVTGAGVVSRDDPRVRGRRRRGVTESLVRLGLPANRDICRTVPRKGYCPPAELYPPFEGFASQR